MRIRFQADNDLRGSIRKGVLRRDPAIDFQSAKAVRLDAVPDQEVLRIAMTQSRILVSHDVNTMPDHFRQFVAAGNRSPGLLLVPQDARIGDVIESIFLIQAASEAEEWTNRIEWLPL